MGNEKSTYKNVHYTMNGEKKYINIQMVTKKENSHSFFCTK